MFVQEMIPIVGTFLLFLNQSVGFLNFSKQHQLG